MYLSTKATAAKDPSDLQNGTDTSAQPPKAGSFFLCRELVDKVWRKHRGDQPGPQEQMIDRAISKSDANSDGCLQRDEISRLATAFVVKSNF